jgi:hypothetical protein
MYTTTSPGNTWWCEDLLPVPYRSNGESMLSLHEKTIVVAYYTSPLTFFND